MKKLLSIILCVAMCLSMFPVGAMAEESTAEEPAELQSAAVEEVREPAPEPEPEPEPASDPEPEPETVPEPVLAEEETLPEQQPAQEQPVEGTEVELPQEESSESGEPVIPEEPGLQPSDSPEETETPSPEETDDDTLPPPGEEGDVSLLPQSVEEDQADAVRVVFTLTPEDAILEVYITDEQGEKIVLQPEEDGSFLLLPGRYFYSASAEGYASAEDVEFEVPAETEDAQDITVELLPGETEVEAQNDSAPWKFWVNPVYSDYYDESDLFVPNDETIELATASSTIYYYNSVESAGAYLRQEMKKRSDTVVVTVSYSLKNYWEGIRDEAWSFYEIPQDPKAGDYLRGNVIGISVRILENYNQGIATITYGCTYTATAAQENEVDREVERLKTQLRLTEGTAYERIKGIYDYLADNISYDTYRLENGNPPVIHSAYGALIEHKCVCQGYAVAFYRLAREAGLLTRYISTADHAWNIVSLNNSWYYVDATWESNRHEAGLTGYEFFLSGTDAWRTNHSGYLGDEYADSTFALKYQVPRYDFVQAGINAVEINASTFPDYYFRNYVLANFDVNPADTLLSEKEVEQVYSMNLSSKGYESLEGIQYFKELVELVCNDCRLTSLNVSGLPNLQAMNCRNNPNIRTINFGGNSGMQVLACDNCGLSNLNVRNFSGLKYLYCSQNQISSLDVTNNHELATLQCYENRISSLDISRCQNLVTAYQKGTLGNYQTVGEYKYTYGSGENDYYLLVVDKSTVVNTKFSAVTFNAGTIRVSTASGHSGETVTLGINLSDNPGVSKITLDLVYDHDALQYAGYNNSVLSGWTVNSSRASWTGKGNSYSNGEILQLKFRILGEAKTGFSEVSVACSSTGAISTSVGDYVVPTIRVGGVNITHDHVAGQVKEENRTEPTCKNTGQVDKVIYCTTCAEELSRETLTLEKLPHTPGTAVRENETRPTCTKNGSYDEVVYCTVCSEELERKTTVLEKIPAQHQSTILMSGGRMLQLPSSIPNGVLTWEIAEADQTAAVVDGYGRVTIYQTNENRRLSVFARNENEEAVEYTLVIVPASSAEVEVPDDVDIIGAGAFQDNQSLTKVMIPESVREIGDNAFSGCGSLTEVDYLGTEEEWKSVVLGSGNEKLTEVQCARTKRCGENVWWKLNAKGVLTIWGTGPMKDIDVWNQPWGHEIKEVLIQDGVTSIGKLAFRECKNLSHVSIPESVTSIGGMAFSVCNALTEVELPGNLKTIGKLAFAYCRGLVSAEIPASVETIEDGAFEGCQLLRDIGTLSGVTEIGEYAFKGCETLADQDGFVIVDDVLYDYVGTETEVSVPDRVTDISEQAFVEKTITSVAIPDGIEIIKPLTFAECSELTSVTIPKSVIRIKKSAFEFSDKLQDVYYAGSEEDWQKIKVADNNDVLSTATIHYGVEVDREGIRLDRDYILLYCGNSAGSEAAETASFTLSGIDKAWKNQVTWYTASGNENVISVDRTDGTVTAVRKGVDYVCASVISNGTSYVARCRVDVVERPSEVEVAAMPAEYRVSLPVKTATVEVFSTEYTQIPVVLNLEQNLGAQSSLISPRPELPDDNGAAIVRAEFEGDAAQWFGLAVVDDRTLAVVPRADSVDTLDVAETLPKSINSKLTAKVKVYLGASETEFKSDDILTLTVKMTQPKVTVKAVKLPAYVNSDVQSEADVLFTGAEVLSAEPLDMPEWLSFESDVSGCRVRYIGDKTVTKAQTGTVNARLTLKGWAIEPTVSFKVTTAPTVVKLTYSPTSLTVNPAHEDEAAATYTLSPIEGPVEVSSIVEGQTATPNGKVLDCKPENGVLTVRTAPGFDASKARTFKVNLAVCGKEYPVTVKTLATGKNDVALTVKAAGTIDNGIPESPITLTVTPKNYNAAAVKEYHTEIHAVRKATKTASPEDVIMSGVENPVFRVNTSGNVITVTAAKEIPEGYTYEARVAAKLQDGTEIPAVTAKMTVKWSDENKVRPTVTLKAAGSIDVIRPDSEIVLTPTIKNLYGYQLDPDSLIVYYKSGSEWIQIERLGRKNPFEPSLRDNSLVLRLKSGSGVNHLKDKYAVGLTVDVKDENGETVRSGETGKPVALSVKMGSAKMNQSTKEIQLLKQDRYSSATFIIGTDDAALSKIAEIVPAACYADYQIEDLGGGKLAVTFTGESKAAKNTSLKFNVFLEGNETVDDAKPKPNAVISVKVTFA